MVREVAYQTDQKTVVIPKAFGHLAIRQEAFLKNKSKILISPVLCNESISYLNQFTDAPHIIRIHSITWNQNVGSSSQFNTRKALQTKHSAVTLKN